MAVTVLGRSALVSRMREIGPAGGPAGAAEGRPAALQIARRPHRRRRTPCTIISRHYLNLEDDLLEGTDLPFQQQQDNRPRFYD